MLAFDLDFETQDRVSPQQNKSTLTRRLQQTQRSAFLSGTFTRGFFNTDNQQEYVYCNQKSNSVIQDKNTQQKNKKEVQRKRSKRKIVKLESQIQSVHTPVYENYIKKTQKQPWFHQSKAQNPLFEIETKSQVYQTRRMAKRRLNKKRQIQSPILQSQKLAQQPSQQQLYFQPKSSLALVKQTQPQTQNITENIIESHSKQAESEVTTEKNLSTHQIMERLQQNQEQQPNTPSIKCSAASNETQMDIKRKYIIKDIKEETTLNCLLVRDNGGFNYFWPQFHLYSGFNNDHIMSAKKISSKPTSTFILSRSKTNFQEGSQFYLGKMKSNILGNVLNLFGPGLNPDNARQKNISPRQLIATIIYNTDIFRGSPKQFQVFVKKQQFSYYSDFPQITMYEDQIPLNELHKLQSNKSKIEVYQNRKAFWSESYGGYMLNFVGRVKTASTKNFILEQKQNRHDRVLFGKVDDSNFNLDISSSVSPMVAFAVALSSFDSRICD